MKRKTFATTVVRRAGDTASCLISTDDVDRDGDTIAVAGWQLQNYRRNPVVLWAHDPRQLPIGKATRIEAQRGRGLIAEWQWAPHPFAAQVREAWNSGYLNATSVGFKPLKYEPNAHGGINFREQELLEFSIVAIPSNSSATRGLKALGLMPRVANEDWIEIDTSEPVEILMPDGGIVHTTRDQLAEFIADTAREAFAKAVRELRSTTHGR
jgi:HK97 family phage prohead protease